MALNWKASSLRSRVASGIASKYRKKVREALSSPTTLQVTRSVSESETKSAAARKRARDIRLGRLVVTVIGSVTVETYRPGYGPQKRIPRPVPVNLQDLPLGSLVSSPTILPSRAERSSFHKDAFIASEYGLEPSPSYTVKSHPDGGNWGTIRERLTVTRSQDPEFKNRR